jgi:hypothetical protein
VRRATVFGDRLHVTAPAAAEEELVRALAAPASASARSERIAPSLEDVFIDRIATAEAA